MCHRAKSCNFSSALRNQAANGLSHLFHHTSPAVPSPPVSKLKNQVPRKMTVPEDPDGTLAGVLTGMPIRIVRRTREMPGALVRKNIEELTKLRDAVYVHSGRE